MKKTREDFIRDAKIIHGDKFDYSFVEYINAKTTVKIICPHHGTFEQSRQVHITLKCGCPKCRLELLKYKATRRIEKSAEEFERKAIRVHGNKYDYNKVKYRRVDVKVDILCPIHGEFSQTPNDHLTGYVWNKVSCESTHVNCRSIYTTSDGKAWQ